MIARRGRLALVAFLLLLPGLPAAAACGKAPDPVVSLHARVCHIRDAEPGTTLGYGATYRASRPERWATLPASPSIRPST